MSDGLIPETDAAEAKRRAEWLHKHKAPKNWIILTMFEVSTIRTDLMALERERDEAREEIVLLKKTPLRKRCQELESALRRLLTADIPRPLGGIIDDSERQAAIEWNAFERGEARQHAKAILQQNKEETK